jgi:hypothetical protein
VRVTIYSGFIFTITGVISFSVTNSDWGHMEIPLFSNYHLLYDFEAVQGRAVGFALHNLAANWYNLLIAMAFTLVMFPEKKYISRYVLLLAIAVLEVGLFLTKSRAGILSQLPMIAFLLFINPRTRRFFIKWWLVFVLSFVFLFVASNPNNPLSFLKRVGVSFSSSASSEVTIGKRIRYWKNGAKWALQSTYGIGGMGIGGFKEYVYPSPHSHSVYISFFHDFGYIGLLILAGLVFVILSGFLRARPLLEAPDTFPRKILLGFYGGMVALGLHSIIEFFYNSPHLWYYLGFGTAVYGMVMREHRARAIA